MEPTQFMQPPPNMIEPPPLSDSGPNMSIPPPNLSAPPPNMVMPPPPRYGMQQFMHRPFFRPFQPYVPRGPIGPMTLEDFDGKRLRKSVMRKTVDYNSSIIEALETRIWQRDFRDRRALQPDVMYYPEMFPPPSYPDNAINCVCTRFVKTATNKMRCPIFCMAWTPEGRRLVTGASSGEFTLWNGLTFNFETILQAHDSPVRTMVWSHNDNWMVTGDHSGYVKYWQSNMNNVKMFQAHKEALRGISFSPMDSKFVTCSDDGTLRIWDFLRCSEERVLRGHGADVKCVHWHPQKGLIVSGSKDNQQPVKLWDPKTGQSLATLHAHKSTVMDLKWNDNGNWLMTASRDHLLKLFDLRNLSQEVQTFRGHKKEASSVAWHPTHEGLFASGGSDGAIMFWHVGADKEVGAIEQAHDSIVWTLAWHPLGHILCSGSNDHSSKFWTRNRPGDSMRDKYNLNTLPAGLAGLEDADLDEPSMIPGMGPEDRVEPLLPVDSSSATTTIPGLDLDTPIVTNAEDKPKLKKVPYSKPIPRNFQAQWNETDDDGIKDGGISEVLSHIVENTPGVVPLQKITPSAIIVYGKLVPVEPGSELEAKIAEGPEALKKYIASGAIEELHDVMPHEDDEDYLNDDDSSTMQHQPPVLSSQYKSLPGSSTSNEKQDGSKNERPRKSRFSDITEAEKKVVATILAKQTALTMTQKDVDMRSGNSSSNSDIDYRRKNSSNRDNDDRSDDWDDREGSDYNEESNSPKRTRYDSPEEEEEERPNSNNAPNAPAPFWNRSPWGDTSNDGNQSSMPPNYNSYHGNYMPNQNNQYNEGQQRNFGMQNGPPFNQAPFSGQMPNFPRPPDLRSLPPFAGHQNNFRPDGPPPWGMPRPDGPFRGGRGFGPRFPMMRGGQSGGPPNRGGNRGGRGGTWQAPAKPSSRGRNTFN